MGCRFDAASGTVLGEPRQATYGLSLAKAGNKGQLSRHAPAPDSTAHAHDVVSCLSILFVGRIPLGAAPPVAR
jgi:hypothetical protein